MRFRKLTRLERIQNKNRDRVKGILKTSADSGNVPIAWAIKVFKNSWIVQCPYCNRKHYHARHEGMRFAHCQSRCGLEEFSLWYRIKVKEGLSLPAIIPEPIDTEFWADNYLNDIRKFVLTSKGI